MKSTEQLLRSAGPTKAGNGDQQLRITTSYGHCVEIHHHQCKRKSNVLLSGQEFAEQMEIAVPFPKMLQRGMDAAVC